MMAYNDRKRFRRGAQLSRYPAKPQPRDIVVKYVGHCAGCGAVIEVGETATYEPRGYLNSTQARLRHPAYSWDDGERVSARCHSELRRALEFRNMRDGNPYSGLPIYRDVPRDRAEQRSVNDYAGDGLDMRWEDQGADICGR
jgi:hypothetical protein